MSEIKLLKDWKIVYLKSISDSIQYGYTESSSKAEIGPKFLRITDIQENKVNWESVPYCKIDKESISKYLLKEGDLVFARTGATVGKSFLIKGKIPEAVFASYLIRVRVNLEINEKYLSYFFQSPEYWKQITNDQVGTGQPNVNGTKLGLLKIVIAPLETQQVIVAKIEELFSELDKGIEDLKTAQLQLKTYRQCVLKWAFEGKLTNENVKEGELPEAWEMIKLDKVADISSSKRIFQDEYVTNGVPFYRTKEVKELAEGKELSIELFISQQKYEEIKSRFKIPQIGDVLLSAVGTIGISYVIKDEKPFYFKDGNLMWFRDLKGIDSHYLHYGLTNFIRNGQGANISGSAYNALTISTMKDFDYPLAPFEEQHLIVQEIESRLSVADKMEESIAQSLQQAEALRQSILKKAFSGELV